MRVKPHHIAGSTIAVIALMLASIARAQFLGPAVPEQPAPPESSGDAIHIAAVAQTIQAGDILAIYVYGVPELSLNTSLTSQSLVGSQLANGFRVDEEGNILFAYLGEVRVAGLSTVQVALKLRAELQQKGLLTDPQISVSYVQTPRQIVTVTGEVVKPAPVAYTRNLRLLDVIASCSGFTAYASHVLTVHRIGMADPITVDIGADPAHAAISNLQLQAGDTVVVPRTGNIYVLGEVKNPSPYPPPANSPFTVMKALAAAGGLRYGAALSKARIYRQDKNGQRTQINLNLGHILHGREKDLVLDSNDILYIPSNAFKAIIAGGGLSVAESIFYGATYAEATLK
jgi:polysaccharide export outer membrane protein